MVSVLLKNPAVLAGLFNMSILLEKPAILAGLFNKTPIL